MSGDGYLLEPYSQTCSLCTDDEFFSFGSVDKLFEDEAKTATRQILKGRRGVCAP